MDRRPWLALRIAVLAASCGMVVNPIAVAQAPSTTAPPADSAPSAKALTQQDLDELMAPIALYPDALLAQILMASTYPLEVVEAARWSKANPSLKDKALEGAMQKQDWDPSVKALTSVPQVLTMMNEKLDWTRKLGDAFLAQQEDLLATAQSLRKKAEAAGNLKSSKELTVTQATEDNVQVIKIEQPNPQVIYVPTYNPAVIYGPWWYPVPPPYYYYPPGYAYGAGLAFATGIVVGAAIWGNVGWGHHSSVNINVNNYNNFNRTNISNTNNNWNHNAQHRQGVPYRDQNTASKYNQGGAQTRNAQSRDQFRGREQGASASNRAAGAGSMGDRGGASASQRASGSSGLGSSSSGSRAGAGASASTRQASGASHGGGFSGAGGGGASARASSSRGSASRGGGGGGRR